MRVVLVFPPRAGATYMPLGIASLAPYIESRVPQTQVRLLDLNIALWMQLAADDSQGQDLMNFVQGRTGDFFDHAQTRFYKVIWDRLRRAMAQLGAQAESYLAGNEGGVGFLSVLGNQVRQILSFEPDIVGVSVLFPEQVPFAAALSRAVKQSLSREKGNACRVVLGGAMMSAMSVSDFLTAVPEIDGVVRGEGEVAAAALCSGLPFETIPGLIYRQGEKIRENVKPLTQSLKNLPAPDFSRLPLDAYFNPVPVVPVLFSRGCAWRKCRFCAHNFSFGGHRKKTAQAFVKELAEYNRTLGANHFYSSDEYILPEDMDAVCKEIIASGLSISFHVLGKPTRECTADRLAFWSAAGCRWIGWGIESGSQRLLDLINKGTCVADIRSVIEHSAAAGISNLGLMIFGLPTSTDDDLKQTFDFLSNSYEGLSITTASAFVLFDKTYFARNAKHYGMHIEQAFPLFHSNGIAVRSHRLQFKETASDGSLRVPRGAMEVSQWQRFRKWLGGGSLLEQLPSEHYLIHVSNSGNGVSNLEAEKITGKPI